MGLDAISDNYTVFLPPDIPVSEIRSADVPHAIPAVSPQAVDGLKFSVALSRDVAIATLGERNRDVPGAAAIAAAPLVVQHAHADPARG